MNNPFKIFAVEDDSWYGEMIKYHLSMNPDYKITLFENAKGALNKLHEKPHLVCIDYNLPDSNGKDLYDTIKRYDPSIEVIIVSSQEEIRVAIELLKNGVYDYIVKDDNAKEMLWNSILKLREKNRLQDEVSDLKNQLVTKFNFEKFKKNYY
ncbi:MAG: response regulator [Lutibacter sp.]|nr:response regulator [Lutibacter sp.]